MKGKGPETMKLHVTLVLAALAVSACSNQVDPTAAPDATGPTAIQVGVAGSEFIVGRPRIPILLFDGVQRVADAEKVVITTFDLTYETPEPGGWSGEAVNYSDYQVPYWVAYPELPHAGFWGLVADITLADGSETRAEFAVQVVEEIESPSIGEFPPASENRTLETEPDISKLSSGFDPDPGLYQMTVAEAMGSGSPTVVTFATPAFCTSQLCAPVVDSVETVYEELGSQVNFIHIEVYKVFNPLILADEMREWRLTTEPWTYVLDSEGRVTMRFSGPLSPRELFQALSTLLP